MENNHSFTIYGRLPNMNQFIGAMNTNRYKGAQMKSNAQKIVCVRIHEELRGVSIKCPVTIHYRFYEPNKRRDKDNISAFAHKVVQDALVECKVLKDDGWEEVVGYTDKFFVDRANPRIEVELEEQTDGERELHSDKRLDDK